MEVKKWKAGDSGENVRKMIESNFDSLNLEKVGFADIQDTGDVKYLRLWPDVASQELYDTDPTAHAVLLIASVPLPAGSGSGGATGAVMRIQVSEVPASSLVSGSPCRFAFTYKSYYGTEDDPSTMPGSVTVTVNGSVVYSSDKLYHGNSYSIDLASYLTGESNSVRIAFNNNEGSTRNYSYTIAVRSLMLVITSFVNNVLISGNTTATVKLTGADANVVMSIDDSVIETKKVLAGSTAAFTIPQQSNGAHVVSFMAVNEEYHLSTTPVKASFISNDGSGGSAVLIEEFAASVEQYQTLSVPYRVGDRAQNFSEVTVTVTSEKGETLYNNTQDIAWNAGITPVTYASVYLGTDKYIGECTVKIKYGAVYATRAFMVAQNTQVPTPAEGCKLYLSAVGRTNSDNSKTVWKDEANNIAVQFSPNFAFSDLLGAGWIHDNEGNDCLRIMNGTYITIPYQLLKQNRLSSGLRTGVCFEVEFATRNCSNRETSILACTDPATGVGFSMTASLLTIKTNSASKSIPYVENQRNRVGFNVDGLAGERFLDLYYNGVSEGSIQYSEFDTFVQNTPQGIRIGSDSCDVDVYVVRCYEKNLSVREILNNYAFDTPVFADKLAIAQRNDVFDSTGNVSFEKLVAARPKLPYIIAELKDDELPAAKDDKTKTGLNWTFFNPLKETITLDDKTYDVHPTVSRLVNGWSWRVQGTSSASYPLPWKNWRMKFKKDAAGYVFELADGTMAKGFAIRPGGYEELYFTLKKDYASSEQSNNIILAMIYDGMCRAALEGGMAGVVSGPMQAAYDAQPANGKNVNAIRNQMSIFGFPIVLWQKWTTTADGHVAGGLRFLGCFNFNNDKDNSKILGYDEANYPEAQIWEISDNKTKLTTTEDYSANSATEYDSGAGRMKCGLLDNLEVRYSRPSKNLDGAGEPVAFGTALSAEQVTQANIELAGLKRFIDWGVKINPLNATGQKLATAFVFGGKTYTNDTVDYRVAYGKSTYQEYIAINSWALYLDYMQRFCMVDSAAKNLHIGTDDGRIWKCFPYDMDTALGINNAGEDTFPPYLEITDQFMGSNVFNGQEFGIWQWLIRAYPELVASIDRTVRNNKTAKFSYEELRDRFNGHQDNWCEALFDAQCTLQYKANPDHIAKAMGDKKNHRDRWLQYAMLYWDSKHYCNKSADNYLQVRVTGSGADLRIKPYCEMYVSVGWGKEGIADQKQQRCLDMATGVTFENGFSAGVTDTILYINYCAWLSDLGNLSSLGDISVESPNKCKRLKRLLVGRDETGFANTKQTTIDVTGIEALEEINLCGCRMLGSGGGFVLDLSKNRNLRVALLKNSSITGVVLNNSNKMETLALPAGLGAIELYNLPNLSTCSVQGVEKITKIYLVNCPKVDSQNIVERVLAAGNSMQSIEIDHINWSNFTVDYLMRLCEMGAKLSGRISLATTSNSTITGAQKAKLLAAYGNIDSEQNSLYVEYYTKTVANIVIQAPTAVDRVGTYALDLSTQPTTGNNFTSIVWSMAANDYGTIDSRTGVVTVNRLGTSSNKPKATVTATMTLLDGTTKVASVDFLFYLRQAEVGDFVYADGSYSDVHNKNKTVVGICYYVDGADRRMLCPFQDNSQQSDLYCTLWGTADFISTYPGYTTIDGVVNRITDFDYESYLVDGEFKEFKSGALSDKNGKENTRCIIQYRDSILLGLDLEIPQTISELKSAASYYYSNVASNTGPYYYIASYCNLYEPTTNENEVLCDKFKKGNWYLPAYFDVVRLWWYFSEERRTTGTRNEAIFKNLYSLRDAAGQAVFETTNAKTGTGSIRFASSTQDSGQYFWSSLLKAGVENSTTSSAAIYVYDSRKATWSTKLSFRAVCNF